MERKSQTLFLKKSAAKEADSTNSLLSFYQTRVKVVPLRGGRGEDNPALYL